MSTTRTRRRTTRRKTRTEWEIELYRALRQVASAPPEQVDGAIRGAILRINRAAARRTRLP